jgi:hypothetical protein
MALAAFCASGLAAAGIHSCLLLRHGRNRFHELAIIKVGFSSDFRNRQQSLSKKRVDGCLTLTTSNGGLVPNTSRSLVPRRQGMVIGDRKCLPRAKAGQRQTPSRDGPGRTFPEVAMARPTLIDELHSNGESAAEIASEWKSVHRHEVAPHVESSTPVPDEF